MIDLQSVKSIKDCIIVKFKKFEVYDNLVVASIRRNIKNVKVTKKYNSIRKKYGADLCTKHLKAKL